MVLCHGTATARIHPVHLTNVAQVQSSHRPLDQANEHEISALPKPSATVLHSPLPKSRYSFYHPAKKVKS